MPETKCPHGAYRVIDGELRCVQCNEPSPRAKLVDGRLVKIGEKPITCPNCGYLIQEGKSMPKPEDKMLGKPEDKGTHKKRKEPEPV